MDVSAFYTPVKTSASDTVRGHSVQGQPSSNAQDFLGMILQELPGLNSDAKGDQAQSLIQGKNRIALTKELDSKLPQFNFDDMVASLAKAQKAGGDIKSISIEITLEDLQSLALAESRMTELLGISAQSLQELQALMGSGLNAQDEPGLFAIISNMTPSMLNTLQQDLTENPDDPSLYAAIAIAMVAPARMSNKAGADLAQSGGQTTPAGQLPTMIQRTQNDGANMASVKHEGLTNPHTSDGIPLDDILNIQGGSDKFSALLKNAAAMRGYTAQISANEGAQAYQHSAQMPATAEAASPLAPPMLLGAMDSVLEALGFDIALASASTGLPSNGLGESLTNVTTQAQNAARPHPSAALVAMTISKVAGNPQEQSVRLQLDPPELGRVDIRMTVGKDKVVKAVVSTEKPEAHMMMQRDAHVLERALQEAGLEMDENSLEFTLADDGQGFTQDGRHDGSRNPAHAPDQADEDIEIIETTMNWYVDPDTGHMRYSILV